MPTRTLDVMRRYAFVLGLAIVQTPISSAEPGQLISVTPISGAPAGATAWRIRYNTTDREGRTVQSTGVLVAPNGSEPTGSAPNGSAPSGGRKVVAWAHGTTASPRPVRHR